MALVRKSALYWDVETTYATDDDADGSDYLHVPANSIGPVVDSRTPLEQNYFNSRDNPSQWIPGPDGWALDVEIPIIGLPVVADDDEDPGTTSPVDWFDALLLHLFGSQTEINGAAIVSATNNGIVLDADLYAVADLMPVWETALPAAAPCDRSQWAEVTVRNSASDYDVAPNWTVNPSSSGQAKGSRFYRRTDNGGSTLSLAVVEDDVTKTLSGGRCSAASLTIPAGGAISMSLTFRGDGIVTSGKGSLATAGNAPAVTPLIGTHSPIWFGGTNYPSSEVTIDLGINAAVQPSTAGCFGRGGDDSISMSPVYTMKPLRTEAIRTLQRSATTGKVLCQLGQGALGSSILNTMAIASTLGQVSEAPLEDESGRWRNAVTIRAVDPGATGHLIQASRA